jgi:hypothetical protein
MVLVEVRSSTKELGKHSLMLHYPKCVTQLYRIHVEVFIRKSIRSFTRVVITLPGPSLCPPFNPTLLTNQSSSRTNRVAGPS